MFNLFSGNSEHSDYFWTSTILPRFDDFNQADIGVLKGGVEWYIYKAAQEKKRKLEESRQKGFTPSNSSSSHSQLQASSESEGTGGDTSTTTTSDGEGNISSSGYNSFVGEEVSQSLHEEDDFFDPEKFLPMKWAIRAKFGNTALTEQEWLESTRLYPTLFQGSFFSPPPSQNKEKLTYSTTGLFFRRLCDMLAIELADKEWLYDKLNGDPVPAIPKPYEFMDPHLVQVGVKVKHTHLVSSRYTLFPNLGI